MSTLKSNDKRARLAILFSWLLVGAAILSLASNLIQLNMLESLVAGVAYDESAIAANDLREGFVYLVALVVRILWYVYLLMWFYRAFANLQTRLGYPLSSKPGWAVGYFFIPILCLYRPYQTMKELYTDTREFFVRQNVPLTERSALKTGWLGVWWTFWLISGIVSNVITRMLFRDNSSFEGLIDLTQAEIVGHIFDIACSILTVIVIRDYSAVEPLPETKDETPA
jgi:hypothetical protein